MRIPDHKFNRLALLKAIQQRGPIARSDLPEVIGVSGARITKLTAELLKLGLITERRFAEGKNGRPKVLLETKADAGIVIGTNLSGAGMLDISFVDLAANVRHRTKLQIGAHSELNNMADAIGDKIAEAIDDSPFAEREIVRVGVSIPAVIDGANGTVHYMTMFPIPDSPADFASRIAQRLNLPVTIENDNACLARAEHWFGNAQHLSCFALVHVGFGIGSANYESGVPAVGTSGINTEIGHVKVDYGTNARQCYCGAKGCLNAYASMYGILEAAHLLDDLPFPPLPGLRQRFAAFLELATQGNSVTSQELAVAGTYLGRVIANHINATASGHTLILFQDAAFLASVERPLLDAVDANVMAGMRKSCAITLASADTDWRWKGAAALALEQTYLANDMPELTLKSRTAIDA